MSVLGVDHYNIRLPEPRLEAVARFYKKIVGLEEGRRPGFQSRGIWLYADGRDVLHLTIDEIGDRQGSGGHPAFDHVAFRCVDVAKHLEILKTEDIRFELVDDPAVGGIQIFLRDPDGRGVELIFKHE